MRSAYGGSLNFGEVASGAVHNLELRRTAGAEPERGVPVGAFHMNNYRRMLDVPAKDDASLESELGVPALTIHVGGPPSTSPRLACATCFSY